MHGEIRLDRYTRGGTGQMRWRLLNTVPVMRADGEDVTRSAAGRHAGELLLYLPTAAVGQTTTWCALEKNRATAHVQLASMAVDVTVTVADYRSAHRAGTGPLG
jgi:Family of unknown function (DUF6544)